MDFSQIIKETLAAGYSERQIAEICGTTQPTVNRIRNGRLTMPNWVMGNDIIQLHKKAMRRRARKAA